MSEIPKPYFSPTISDDPPSQNRFTSPRRPPTLSVPSPGGVALIRSADNSPHSTVKNFSSSSLSPSDKKSLKMFISLVNNFNNAAERLFGFCEHAFIDELAQLAIDQIDKHLLEFRELLVRISSQHQVVEDLQQSRRPSPVTFSISTWRNLSSEEWPVSTSREWVNAASSLLKITPPELTASPKREGPPLEERLAQAELKRQKIENLRNREIRQKTNKVRRANERRVQQQEEAISTFNEKQDSAAQRREAHINSIKEKAHSEIEKVQETKFMHELENEDRKLKMERNMHRVTKKYEDMVKDKKVKAKERSTIKSPTSPENSGSPKSKRRAVRIKENAVIEAISHGELPGDFLDIGDEFSDSIPAVELPEYTEPDPNPSAAMKGIIAKMGHNEHSSQLAINYLKAVSDQKTNIKWNSEEGQMIRESLQNMIYLNIPNTNQLVHHVVSLAQSSSYPFALHVAFECISSFRQFCYKQDSLSTTNELLTLWKTILVTGFEEPKVLMISHLIRHGVLMKLCYVLEATTASDIRREALLQLSLSILALLESCTTCVHNNFPTLAAEPKEFFEHAAFDFIVPGLLSFLTNSLSLANQRHQVVGMVEGILSAIAVYSSIAIDFRGNLPSFLEKANVKAIANVFDSFYNEENKDLKIVNALIVLIGLLADCSPLLRSYCTTKPNVLAMLCSMPLNYFIKPPDALVLIPTIIAFCQESQENIDFIKKNVNGAFIVKFLEDMKNEDSGIISPCFRISANKVPDLIKSFRPTK